MTSSVHKTIAVEYVGDTEANLKPISVLITTTKQEKSEASFVHSATVLSSDALNAPGRSYWLGVLNTLRGLTPVSM